MRILLIGGGGREHALAWKLVQSPNVEKLYAAPGNPGMALLQKCECINLNVDDLEGVADYAEEKSIDLTVVGPEAPLVAGLADVFKRRGLPVFGPSKAAAQLEGYNAAIAYVMNNDLAAAKKAIANETSADADYLRAVIAAKEGQVATAKAQLKSAIAKAPELAEKAAKDVLLKAIMEA